MNTKPLGYILVVVGILSCFMTLGLYSLLGYVPTSDGTNGGSAALTLRNLACLFTIGSLVTGILLLRSADSIAAKRAQQAAEEEQRKRKEIEDAIIQKHIGNSPATKAVQQAQEDRQETEDEIIKKYIDDSPK